MPRRRHALPFLPAAALPVLPTAAPALADQQRPAVPTSDPMVDAVMAMAAGVRQTVAAIGDTLASAPESLGLLVRALAGSGTSRGELWSVLLFVLVVAGSGLLAEFVFRRHALRPFGGAEPSSPARRALRSLLAVAVFAAAAFLTGATLPEGGFIQRLGATLVATVVVVRLITPLVSLFVIFGRLSPDGTGGPELDRLHRWMLITVLLAAAGFLLRPLLHLVLTAPPPPTFARFMALTTFTLLSVAYLRTAWSLGRVLADRAHGAGGGGSRSAGWFALVVLYVAAVWAVTIGMGHMAPSRMAWIDGVLSLLLLPVVVLVAQGLGRSVAGGGAAGPMRSGASVKVAGAAIFLYALARIWGIRPFALFERALGPEMADRMFHIALTLLLAHLAWEAAASRIDAWMEREAASEHTDEDDVAHIRMLSRLGTLLLLLRRTVKIVIGVVALFVVLNHVGIDTSALLAGAGVVGIAVGFGSQLLVRDIISGLFFLFEDSFRIGEYVEIGTIRGTVEQISIRSLKLRHQRGPVHTVPFGEIKSLTNHSRDWVILKLEFRLAFGTDLAKVKKIVKRLGQELMENPELAPSFLAPLKSQGIRRIEETGLIVGVKFTAKPGEQFILRREVYQRLCAAFIEAGIEFARPQVVVHGGPAGGEAAAAIQAAQGTVRTPAPAEAP